MNEMINSIGNLLKSHAEVINLNDGGSKYTNEFHRMLLLMQHMGIDFDIEWGTDERVYQMTAITVQGTRFEIEE